MNFTKDQMLKMYDDLLFARALGDKIVEYIYGGKIAGAIHPSLGQEAISAGHMSARAISDRNVWVSFTHRMQAVMADYLGLDPFLAEMLNKRTGCCGGSSGEYHVADLEKRGIPAQGVLGGAWPVSVGVAWALKASGKTNDIVVTSYGDGASSEGVTWEAMNFAAIHKLPILFIVENNGVAMSTPLSKQSPIEELSLRAKACGMKGITIDGNDVLAVTEALLTGYEMAAKNEPSLIEFKTWRWEGHFVGDDQSKYRDVSFRDNLDEIDPVLKFRKVLEELGYTDEAYTKRVLEEKTTIVVDSFNKAIAADFPTKEECLDYNKVYATKTGGAI